VNRILAWAVDRFSKWLEPELFQPFVFGVLISLTLSEFVRGALTLSMLPTYGKRVLGFAVEWTALALSIHYLADNLLRSPIGWLADRFGQRTVVLTGFAIAAGAVFWMMNARTVPALIASLAVYGIGVTPMWPAAVSGIATATPEQSRAQFMGYMYVFWMAGIGLGPIVINLVIGQTYTLAFWLLIAVEIIGFLLAWVLIRHRPQPHGDRSDAATRRHVTWDRAYWQSLWRNVKQVAFLFPAMFAQTFAVASLIPILSLYANVVLHLSGAMYSTILVVGGGLTVLLLVPAGRLVDRYGARKFLVTAFLVSGAALIVYPFFHALWTTFLAVGILGICYALILPAWNSVLDRSIDPDKKGALWGVFMTVEGLGSAAGPYVGGLVWDTVSPHAPFIVSGVVILVMGLLYIILPIELPKRSVPSPDSGTAGHHLLRRRQRT
jgi:MFS family permease